MGSRGEEWAGSDDFKNSMGCHHLQRKINSVIFLLFTRRLWCGRKDYVILFKDGPRLK